MKRAYIAGPLFTESERYFLEKIDKICQKMGIETFLPHRDVDQSLSPEKIFEQDLENIRKADMLIAVLEGPDVDSGTSFELGVGYQLGKYIIGIRTDSRAIFERAHENPLEIEINLMIRYSLDQFHKNLRNFEEGLEEYLAEEK